MQDDHRMEIYPLDPSWPFESCIFTVGVLLLCIVAYFIITNITYGRWKIHTDNTFHTWEINMNGFNNKARGIILQQNGQKTHDEEGNYTELSKYRWDDRIKEIELLSSKLADKSEKNISVLIDDLWWWICTISACFLFIKSGNLLERIWAMTQLMWCLWQLLRWLIYCLV